MTTLIFKTRSPFFEKERDNLKCNTVREMYPGNDIRYEELMHILQTKEEFLVKIINPKTKEEFIRMGSDVTYYDERFIISWHTPPIKTTK